mmetsp:Transcript_9274/g.16868  ORF Transcript_9274/g.16868 Transcript_9274/m.16868 type:complete len:204 (+) Transcript_9274:1153-1764(+)
MHHPKQQQRPWLQTFWRSPPPAALNGPGGALPLRLAPALAELPDWAPPHSSGTLALLFAVPSPSQMPGAHSAGPLEMTPEAASSAPQLSASKPHGRRQEAPLTQADPGNPLRSRLSHNPELLQAYLRSAAAAGAEPLRPPGRSAQRSRGAAATGLQVAATMQLWLGWQSHLSDRADQMNPQSAAQQRLPSVQAPQCPSHQCSP